MKNSLKQKIKRKLAKRRIKSSKKSVNKKRHPSAKKGFRGNIFRFALIIIAIVFVVFGFVFFFAALRAYYLLDFAGETTWNGESDLNILVLGVDEKDGGYRFVDFLAVIHASKHEERVGVINIDPDIEIQTQDRPASFRSVLNMYETDQEGIGAIKEGVLEEFAIKIDKYLLLDEELFLALQSKYFSSVALQYSEEKIERDYLYKGTALTIKKGLNRYDEDRLLGVISSDAYGIDSRLNTQNVVVSSLMDNLASPGFVFRVISKPELLNELDTNLSRRELLDLFLFLRKNSNDKVFVYTAQSAVVSKNNAGYTTKSVLFERVQQDIQKVFVKSSILNEQIRVEVLNATNTPGLATMYSKIMQNSGVRVVREGNAVGRELSTTLYISDYSEDMDTINYIKSIFDDKITLKNEEYRYKHIGDIVLVIEN